MFRSATIVSCILAVFVLTGAGKRAVVSDDVVKSPRSLLGQLNALVREVRDMEKRRIAYEDTNFIQRGWIYTNFFGVGTVSLGVKYLTDSSYTFAFAPLTATTMYVVNVTGKTDSSFTVLVKDLADFPASGRWITWLTVGIRKKE